MGFCDVRALLRDSTFLLLVWHLLRMLSATSWKYVEPKVYCYELTYCTRHFSAMALFYDRHVTGYKCTTLYGHMHNQ